MTQEEIRKGNAVLADICEARISEDGELVGDVQSLRRAIERCGAKYRSEGTVEDELGPIAEPARLAGLNDHDILHWKEIGEDAELSLCEDFLRNFADVSLRRGFGGVEIVGRKDELMKKIARYVDGNVFGEGILKLLREAGGKAVGEIDFELLVEAKYEEAMECLGEETNK